jgi:ABC-2 type transport system ATP-binding protein
VIEAKAITRKYDDFTAVDNVSFNITQGEIVGLLGHNGAGKTTIMKMLTGFLEPTAGTIVIDNMNMAENRYAIQARIGYLPENCPLYPEMTAIDYLEYAASLHGITDADQPINTLSRGYRQRVGVAQAILKNPKILILDEPTNGLDPSQIQHMRALIREFGQKSTVIVSTHILQELEAVCDRVLIIRSGKLVLDSKMEDLSKSRRLLLSVAGEMDDIHSKLLQINNISGIECLSKNGVRKQYALNLNESVSQIDMDEVAPLVAKAVMDGGHKLYAIHPETRDLETVFREINAAIAVKEGGAINAE